ncbi:MAG: hypothetical protein HYX92_02155 [Chloroflexi bacterium]|nr:hypothetical protein [Chloroflexota bacterium]
MHRKGSLVMASCSAILALLGCAPAATPATVSPPAAAKVETPAARAPVAPTAPASTPRAATPKYGGILTSWDAIEPEHLDIHQASSGGTLWPMGGVYNGLIQRNPLRPYNIVPELAQSWELGPDGKSYIFSLAPGVKWHDGQPFTSEDVKFSLDRMRDPPRGVVSPRKTQFVAVDKITPGQNTVKVDLTYPSPSFLATMASGWSVIMPKHVIQARGDMKRDGIGTGPFKFKQYTPGTQLTTEKNKDYFVKGRPYLDGINWYLIKDPAVQFAAFRTKRVIVTGYGSRGLSPVEVEVARREIPNVSVYGYGGGSGQDMTFNATKPPFSDARVRQAAVMALDQSEIIKAALQGGGLITSAIGPPSHEWALPETELLALPGIRKPAPADIAQARKLLEDAGLPNGIKAVYPFRTAARFGDVAQVVKDQLSKIGIDLTLQGLDAASFPEIQRRRNFDIIQTAHVATISDPDGLLRWFVTGSPDNLSGFSDPTVDDLYSRQSRTTDPAERKKIVNQLERRVMELLPIFRLFELTNYVAHWPELKGYEGLETSMNNTRWAHVWLE